jgi:23S rRNA (pseudouridine1915-N3)-methyltransferase
MQLTLAHVATRSPRREGFDGSVTDYLDRCAAFARCRCETFRNEEALLAWLDRQRGRTPATAVLFDGRGRQMTSQAFAEWLGSHRDQGVQHIVFAIGPADGWTAGALGRAQLVLSLGPWTLPHALARLVVAEQIYRAYTILSGHPYHAGH